MSRIALALAWLCLLWLSPAHCATSTQIVNAGNGLCMGIAGASAATLAPVVQITCSGGADTAWNRQPQGNGYYQVVSQASGLCLKVNGGVGAAGSTLVQFPCGAGALNDQWALAAVGNSVHLVSLGSGLCGDGCAQNHADAEILSPPYLFNSNGTAATRPVIKSAPTTGKRGASITVSTNTAVSSFALVRLGAVTHTTNNDQRRVPLKATNAGTNTYSLAIPSDPGVVLPGYYMLFAMSANRVPSVAATIQIP